MSCIEFQLSTGELDVIRINKERQAAMDRGEITNDKRHLLRGMAALAHIQKVSENMLIDEKLNEIDSNHFDWWNDAAMKPIQSHDDCFDDFILLQFNPIH